MEPSLTRALRSHVHDKLGQLVQKCDHEHYFFGYDTPQKHAGYYRLSIGGTELAISPTTLDTLRGKCLSIQQLARLDEPSKTSEILVATPLDDATRMA
jgi:hypothetical protein